MAPLLSPEALASLRTFQAAYGLPEQVVLKGRVAVPDGSGGRTVTWPDGATVAARFSPAAGAAREGMLAERPTARNPSVLHTPYGTVLTAQDQVRSVTTGRVYEVLGVPEQSWARVQLFNVVELP